MTKKPKRRGKYDHLAEILQAAKHPTSAGELMHIARLGGIHYKTRIQYAVSVGLLQKIDKLYQTTAKGKKYLTIYNQMQFLMGNK